MGLVLVGFDGSPSSRRATELAARRSRAHGDELALVTVVPRQVIDSSLADLMPAGFQLPPELSRTFHENARTRLEEVAAALRQGGAKVQTHVRAGDAGATLLQMSEELHAAELVIGQKAFEDPRQPMGRNAALVLRGAKVPVTIVP
ncbi:MAG TPA: universal stress protein [Candidatus Thermoplasmatota archaeon]|nr:universal stress protein [Candidatus Thermoplasmatota archaeon]